MLRKIGFSLQSKSRWLLVVAGIIYLISWWLPSFEVFPGDFSFVKHLVGGGIFSGIVWLYIRQALDLKRSWLADALAIFALTSSLGVLNELLELGLNLILDQERQIMIFDTSYDLLANSLGALAVHLVDLIVGLVDDYRHR